MAASLREAEALILGGKVRVPGVPQPKAGLQVKEDTQVDLQGSEAFASRGGHKLKGALDRFGIKVQGAVCADVGCSSGGFTDVLIKEGAAKVFAIDVGYGDLAWHLRSNSKVVVMERMNACYVENLGELVSLIVIDVSLLSLTKVLPNVRRWLASDGQLVALVKPQYEALPGELPEGAIIEDAEVHRAILSRLLGWCEQQGLAVLGLVPASIRGMGGNQEFLLWLGAGESVAKEGLIGVALAELSKSGS